MTMLEFEIQISGRWNYECKRLGEIDNNLEPPSTIWRPKWNMYQLFLFPIVLLVYPEETGTLCSKAKHTNLA
jgi:hypothetical protein